MQAIHRYLPFYLQGNHGDLSESEKLQLTLHYYMQSLGVQLAQNVIDRYSNI